MTTQTFEALPIQQTEHPYIIRSPHVCGGRPIIKNSRISVRAVAQLYKAGDLVEEIVQTYPHLSAAAVHDAISYYLDHQAEIEQEIAENRLETVLAGHNAELDERGFVSFHQETAVQ